MTLRAEFVLNKNVVRAASGRPADRIQWALAEKMRFALLEVEIESVFVILWTAKVVNKSKKSMESLIFCPISWDSQLENVQPEEAEQLMW